MKYDNIMKAIVFGAGAYFLWKAVQSSQAQAEPGTQTLYLPGRVMRPVPPGEIVYTDYQ